jgi:hypothetical protein
MVEISLRISSAIWRNDQVIAEPTSVSEPTTLALLGLGLLGLEFSRRKSV